MGYAMKIFVWAAAAALVLHYAPVLFQNVKEDSPKTFDSFNLSAIFQPFNF